MNAARLPVTSTPAAMARVAACAISIIKTTTIKG
jgi:hypothetical protein